MANALTSLKNLILRPFHSFRAYSWKKKIVVSLIIIVILIGVSKFFSKSSNKSKYITVKAAKSDITELVSETGSIAISGKTDIYSPTNGIVENIMVKNGDSVVVGQELFTIKSSATEQEKAQALAAYMAAKNTVDTANSTLLSLQSAMFAAWERHKTLAESDRYENSDGTPRYDQRSTAEYHIAEKDWLAAESNFKKQQSVISQARVSMNSLWLAYQATQNASVKATVDGTVSNVSITTGNTVKANSLASPVTPLATIANLTTTEVLVSLSENDIAKIQEGQKATIDVNAIPDMLFEGLVKRVDTIGTTQQGVIRYNTYIEVLNPSTRLRPGMNVDVVITTNEAQDVLSVPNAAIKPHNGGRAVRVPDEKTGEMKYVKVEIGMRGKEKTEILSGIKEGQTVITSLSNEQIKRPGLLGN